MIHVRDPGLLPEAVRETADRRFVRDAGLERRLRRLHREFEAGAAASPPLVERLVIEVFSLTWRHGKFDALDVPPWLARARDRLAADPAGIPSFSRLADEVGVHPTHLSRSFRRHYGMRPSTFVRRLRLERARGLVIGSDVPLAEVAYRTGFSDQPHMTRAFASRFGLTPGRMRSSSASPSR